MNIVLGVSLGILIPFLWFFFPSRKIPKENRIKIWKIIVSIVIGMTLCTACIAIPEITWDSVAKRLGYTGESTNIASAAITAFSRAALIEEGVKFLFVLWSIRLFKPKDKLQYMLLAGTIGMGYGITEKIMYGGTLFIMVTNAFFALHIFFQFLMGAFLFEAKKAKQMEDKKKRGLFIAMALVIPMLCHGTWDFILMSAEVVLAINDGAFALSTAIVVILFFLVIAGVAYGEVRMAMYLFKLNKKVRAEDPKIMI